MSKWYCSLSESYHDTEKEAHWDEMEADCESVDDYLRNGWLKNC